MAVAKADYVKFTKEMRDEYTILVPTMLPIHFKLISNVLVRYGYKIDFLEDVDGNIKDFAEGYDTVLGERGVTVSGGQKQRISIARALMKNPSILILDDSVSAVDVKTEKIILDNLKRLRRGKTTILIAHRVSTVASMDKILFLDEGKLLAVGSHEELYNTCPEYRHTVELQKLDESEVSA